MKKVLALVISLALVFNAAIIPVSAATAVQQFTTNFEQMYNSLDPMNPYVLPFQGFFEQTFKVGEADKTFKVYIPSGIEHQARSVFVLAPSGESAVDLLDKSGWKELAEKDKFYLYIIEPGNGKWDASGTGTDVDYVTAVVNETKKRKFYTPYPGNCYLVGYKDGAVIAQQTAIKTPDAWAGVATFGELNVNKEYMNTYRAKASADPYYTLNQVPVPMWIIAPNIGVSEQAVVEYWKNANKVEKTAYKNDYTSFIYAPSMATMSRLTDEQPVAKVLVTQKDTTAYDINFNKVVWNDFLSKTGRFVAIGNGDLRAMLTKEEAGMIDQKLVVDGYLRKWQEYVPTKAKANPAIKVPLVVVFHGGGNAAEAYINYLQWFKVAEERNFIVVLPQALPSMSKTSIPSCNWNYTADKTRPDDVNFVKAMVNNIKSRYSIDDGKLFASGMSLGSLMSNRVAMALPDVFTAIGSCSGVILGGKNSPLYTLPDVNTNYQIPVWIIMGENDIGGGTYDKNGDAKLTMEYWTARNQTKSIYEPQFYKNGLYNNYLYTNANNVPMVRYTIVDGKGHATLPSEPWMLWDEFFCKYNRNANGIIEFQGIPVK